MERKRLLTALSLVTLIVTPCFAGQDEAPFEKGLVLGLYSSDPSYEYKREVREIAGLGADAVCFIVRGYMDGPEDTAVQVEPEGPPSTERVREVISNARSRGLLVLVMPVVLLRNPPSTSDWRGNIGPSSWDEWFKSYRAFLLYYAKLAEDSGATSFSVGSELCSAEGHTDKWRDLIADVRKVFSGPLLYSANWDHFEDIQFFDDLDFIGVNGYEELTEQGEEPSLEDMRKVWAETRSRFLEWQKRWGKELVITEAGYASQKGITAHPWDYTASNEVDLEIQDQAYQVLFDTWRGQEKLAALFVFDWWGKGGRRDNGYTARGKPAEKRLKSWFAED